MFIPLARGCCWRGFPLPSSRVCRILNIMVCCQRQKSQRGEPMRSTLLLCRGLFQCWDCQLRDDVLFSMGIALGSTPGVGQPYAVRQQPTSPVLPCAQRERWLQQAVTGRCFCSLVPIWPICLHQQGEYMLVTWKVRAAPPEVTAAALPHLCVWEPKKGPGPQGSSIRPIFLPDSCMSSVLNSLRSYIEA